MSDPVLGPIRTMRLQLIVAGAVNTICKGMAGAPTVTALKNGWLIAGPSGATWLCHTVEEIWTTILGCFTDISLLGCLLKRQQAYADDPDNEGLPARSARIGSGLTALAAV